MSETPHNELERDAMLTAIYRTAGQAAPPAALDAAILAAARREVGARPRPAGFSFGGSWRTSLSIAAVLVLSVSLVTLMREEASELTAPPRANVPAVETKLKSSVAFDDNAATGDGGLVREEQKSKNTGLKPPQPASSVGLGMRQPEFMENSPRSKKDAIAGKSELDAAGPAGLAKRRAAAPDAVDLRDSKVAASTERQRQPAPLDAQREIVQAPAAAPPGKAAAKPARAVEPAADRPIPFPAIGASSGALTENKTQIVPAATPADRVDPASRGQADYAPAKQAAESPPASVAGVPPAPAAPQAKPASPAVTTSKLERAVDLPPEKWLERIEELRKQGKFEEVRASLADFRKRYPDYRLPDSLRDWAKP